MPFTNTNESAKYLLHINDIVFARTGATVGKSFLITELPYETVYASYLIRIRLIGEILPQYIYQFFNSQCYWKQITGKAVGVGQPNCNGTSLKELFIPFPPLSEQERIVSIAEEILEYVDIISQEEIILVNLINNTKSKILDLAIRGKLVPQDPNDEPASVLLDRIRAEKEERIKQGKIKRDKKESIFRGDDNSYYEKLVDGSIINVNNEICFDLPDGWIWLRGRNCFAEMESRKPDGESFDYIDIDSVNNKSNVISSPKHILCSEAPSRASRAVFDGSVVFSLVRPYLKNIAYIDESLAHCIASTGFYVCTSNGILYSKYMFLLLISDYTIQGLNQYMKGDNSPSIRKDDIENWLFPIPPYNEQIRIFQQWRNYNAKFSNIEANFIQD